LSSLFGDGETPSSLVDIHLFFFREFSSAPPPPPPSFHSPCVLRPSLRRKTRSISLSTYRIWGFFLFFSRSAGKLTPPFPRSRHSRFPPQDFFFFLLMVEKRSGLFSPPLRTRQSLSSSGVPLVRYSLGRNWVLPSPRIQTFPPRVLSSFLAFLFFNDGSRGGSPRTPWRSPTWPRQYFSFFFCAGQRYSFPFSGAFPTSLLLFKEVSSFFFTSPAVDNLHAFFPPLAGVASDVFPPRWGGRLSEVPLFSGERTVLPGVLYIFAGAGSTRLALSRTLPKSTTENLLHEWLKGVLS